MGTSFASFLRHEWQRRRAKNARYSLRAFARDLNTSASSLSRVMSGERAVSKIMKTRLLHALGQPPALAGQMSDVEDSELPPAFARIEEDAFAVIADWHHYALLELLQTTGARGQPAWIARKLKISVDEATFALERLGRLGLVRFTAGGAKIVRENNSNVLPLAQLARSKAHRAHQRQVLRKALDALEAVPLAQRDQSSMTMAIPAKLLPKAIRMIDDFRREFCATLQRGSRKDAVYQLSLSFFPLVLSEAQADLAKDLNTKEAL